MFSRSFLLTILALVAATTATLDPATSNTKGKYPSNPSCSRTYPAFVLQTRKMLTCHLAAKISKAIQAAECSHNTRVSGTQTFAIFIQDHQYDGNNGYPYGTCEAYTCEAGTEMTSDGDYWTFYWGAGGEEEGEGAGCIKSPDDGTCGCENSDGTFVYGGNDCV